MAPGGMYANAPSPMIVPYTDFVLAILNSKLGDWYIRQLGVTRNGGYFEYKPMFVEQLPIPQLTSDEQSEFLSGRQNGKEHRLSEREIDLRTCDLYGLTLEECRIILDGA